MGGQSNGPPLPPNPPNRGSKNAHVVADLQPLGSWYLGVGDGPFDTYGLSITVFELFSWLQKSKIVSTGTPARPTRIR